MDAVPTHHSWLLKIPCFGGQVGLRFLTLLSRTRRQAHLRSFKSGPMIAARRQCMFAVITPCLKEKHKRLVDFGWRLTWAPGRVWAAPVRTWPAGASAEPGPSQPRRLGLTLLPADSRRLSLENHPRGTKRGTGVPIKSSSLLPPAKSPNDNLWSDLPLPPKLLTELIVFLWSLWGNILASESPIHSGRPIWAGLPASPT